MKHVGYICIAMPWSGAVARVPRSEGGQLRDGHQLPQGHPFGPDRVPVVVPVSSPLPTGPDLAGDSESDPRPGVCFGVGFRALGVPYGSDARPGVCFGVGFRTLGVPYGVMHDAGKSVV